MLISSVLSHDKKWKKRTLMTAVCRSRYLAIVLCAFIVALAAAQPVFDTDILVDTFGFDENTKKTVPLHLLRQGCAARDCIPSIDKPKFVAANELIMWRTMTLSLC